MPPTATGHALSVLKTGMAPPRVVVLIVLDGMRRDNFDRYATLMPTLTALRQRGVLQAVACDGGCLESGSGGVSWVSSALDFIYVEMREHIADTPRPVQVRIEGLHTRKAPARRKLKR